MLVNVIKAGMADGEERQGSQRKTCFYLFSYVISYVHLATRMSEIVSRIRIFFIFIIIVLCVLRHVLVMFIWVGSRNIY